MRSVEERLRRWKSVEYRRTHKQAEELRDDVFQLMDRLFIFMAGYKIVELILGTPNGKFNPIRGR